jgi:hypothetical protein
MFTFKKVLHEKGATQNIPPFASSKKQFSEHEIHVHETEEISRLRINKEGMNSSLAGVYHMRGYDSVTPGPTPQWGHALEFCLVLEPSYFYLL